MSRNLLNSDLAAVNFSGDSLRALAKTGRPSVTMWWATQCRAGVSLVQGVVNDGKSFKSLVNWSGLVVGV